MADEPHDPEDDIPFDPSTIKVTYGVPSLHDDPRYDHQRSPAAKEERPDVLEKSSSDDRHDVTEELEMLRRRAQEFREHKARKAKGIPSIPPDVPPFARSETLSKMTRNERIEHGALSDEIHFP